MYEAKWNGFCTWCEEHGFSAMHPTVPIIAEFFLFLFSEKKLLPQTIEGYRSALSMKLDADLELGSNKELKRLIQSFYKSRPKTSRHIPSWDLTLVLQALTRLLLNLCLLLSQSSSLGRRSFLLPLHLEGEGVRFMPLLLRVVLTLKDGQRSSLKQILLFWLRTS